jgi:hypothetical protein
MALYWNNRGTVNSNGNTFVNTWVPPDIAGLEYNTRLVEPDEAGRLDLISFRVYGTEQYFWVLAHFNNILDIFNGFSVGDTIMVPILNTYLERWQSVNSKR